MSSTALALELLDTVHPRLHLLIFLLMFWLLHRTRALHASVRAMDGVLGGRLGASVRCFRAKRAELRGEWAEAGELYEELGNGHRAIDCFERSEDYDRCADICVRLARGDDAAEWMELAGEPRFAEAKLSERAADAYVSVAAHLRAAEALVERGDYHGAARLYREHGAFELASEAFAKARQLDPATRGSEHASALTPARSSQPAATVAERLRRYRAAARDFLESGNRARASAMFALAGDPLAALHSEAEHHLDNGRPRAGAECLWKAGDPLRAADVFRSIGELERAADCLAEGGDASRPTTF